MDGKENWIAIRERIQERSINATPLKIEGVKKAKTFYVQIQKCLIWANSNGVLKTSPEKIRSLLKITKDKEKFEITGGERNFKRVKAVPHFERMDSCWFDFAILMDEGKTKDCITCIGFNFEIRFPPSVSPYFLRFDLNLPNHHNDDRGLRLHIHPGNDDLMIHSPPMSPLEILHLFLYGLPIPNKSRSS